MLRPAIALVLALSLAPSLATAQDEGAKKLAQSLLDKGAATYNKADADAMVLQYDDDAKVVLVGREENGPNLVEKTYRGPESIRDLYVEQFAGAERPIRSSNRVEFARFLRPDVLAIYGTFSPSEGADPLPFFQVRQERDGHWLIVSLRLFVIAERKSG